MTMVDEKTKALINKALHTHQLGNFQEAESSYRTFLSQNIPVPIIYTKLASICAVTNRQDEAKQLTLHSLKLLPEFIDGLILLGDLFRLERNFPVAIDFYHRALKQNRTIAVLYLHISFSWLQLGEIGKAKSACFAALKIERGNVSTQLLLAQIYTVNGELEDAKNIYQNILDNSPQNLDALYNLANVFKYQGDLSKAKALYLDVIVLNSTYVSAHYSFASIHKYESIDEPQVLQMLSQISDKSSSEEERVLYFFALAKVFEDCGEYDQAFQYLKQGNDLRFSRFNYDIKTDEDFITSIMASFTKDALASVSPSTESSKRPIFIVGMPRSGTSLAEKILASHSKVHGGGELEYFFRLGTRLFIDESTNFLYKNISTYDANKFVQMAENYLKQIETLNNKAEHVTDKLPLNMLLIGLIKLAFPNAKIIHCKRSPIDNCLSIYKKNFTTDNYRFAYNLKTIGQFYNIQDKLMSHWYDLFPSEIYTLNYEDLIQNPEKIIQDLIMSCDLEWEENCLNFHKTKSIVTTASAFQVRQPIYKTSIELWKKYEQNLSSLITELSDSLLGER